MKTTLIFNPKMFVMKKIVTLMLLVLTAFNFTSKAQTNSTCNADFTFNISSNTVKFTPVMPGDSINTLHYWGFGDGTTAAATAPVHTYASAGVYSVKHYIIKRNPNGIETCRDSAIKQIIIQPACNLVAYFTWQSDSSNYLKIRFTNASTTAEPSDSVRWTFGDGTSSLDANPAHLYANAGTYTVCLRVKKNNTTGTTGCVREICKTIVVTQPCNLTANFSWANTTANPLTVAFKNLSTPLSSTDSVKWSFGDGSTSLDANPMHTYQQSGVYSVCLRVKKNGNTPGTAACVREICKLVIVQLPCNIQVNFSMHRDSLNPRKVHFNNSTITTTAAATVKWSFGDGTYATSWNAIHEYSQPGTYRVCLVVEAAPNCVREKCDTVIMPVPGPSCEAISKFRFEKFSNDNQNYKFIPDNLSNDLVYTWTFGDGTGSHDPIVAHRYTKPGLYTACLTAWRGPNCASTTCKEIRVMPQINCDSIRIGYAYQRDPLLPNKVYFNANASWPILDQIWTITKLSLASQPPVVLHQNNPAYLFRDTGYYRVCLKAITLGGCVKEYCNVIRIERVVNTVCELQAFPNPASSLVNVNVSLTQSEIIHAYVYNTLNVLVRDISQQGSTGNNAVSIKVNDLVPGLYTIRIVYGNKTCYAKFNKI
jgi:PKD repeat protein